MARGANLPSHARRTVVAVWLALIAPAHGGEVPAPLRTADMPDSWLVLYNSNGAFGAESTNWADWYRLQHGIPDENMLGLDISTNAEHLSTYAEAEQLIFQPVRDYLGANPAVQARTMGILLGYGVPGHFDRPVLLPNMGGWSVAGSLQDVYNTTSNGLFGLDDNPAYAANADLSLNLPASRLTKATMPTEPGSRPRYLTARIDAPSLAAAMAMTTRAQDISSNGLDPGTDVAYWDGFDPDFPGASHWGALEVSVEQECIPAARWVEFDLDTNGGHDAAAVRFDVYRVSGWGSYLSGAGGGSRVLAYDLNSFGAISVRTTGMTAYGIDGVFVPNAIAAGYAAAVGATGEPTAALAPHPGVQMAALERGWTLGEAFFLSTGTENGFWNLIGDPLLTVARWWPIDDCNSNGVADECEDCNTNGFADECDISAGISTDCNVDGLPDECQFADCNGNGLHDSCEVADGAAPDCNANFMPDDCELAGGTSPDCNANAIPDECDLFAQTSGDCNTNGVPDECDTTAPAVTYFFDSFPNSGAPDPVEWPSSLASTSTGRSVSPPRSLRFLLHRWATTRDIDLSDVAYAEVRFWALPLETCAGIDLEVDYWDGAAWRILVDVSGGSPQDVWASYTAVLPPAALHATFRLDFRNVLGASCPGSKLWYVDDVEVVGAVEDCNGNLVPDTCEIGVSGPVGPAEFAVYPGCLGGPCVAPDCAAAGYADDCCRLVDADADGDVDLEDFAAFQQAFTP